MDVLSIERLGQHGMEVGLESGDAASSRTDGRVVLWGALECYGVQSGAVDSSRLVKKRRGRGGMINTLSLGSDGMPSGRTE